MENLDKKAVFQNTFWQVATRFAMLFVTLISIKVLTNYLGASGVGEYNTITTYINFFVVLADLGLFAVTVREISRDERREREILSNVLSIRLISAVVASAIAVLIVFATNYSYEIKNGVLIATGFLFFNLMASVFDMAMQHRLRMQYSAFAEFLGKILFLIVLYLIVIFKGNFLWITSTIAIWGFSIFIFKWLFSMKFARFWFRYDKKVVRWIMELSWPLGIVFIVSNLYYKIDTMMLFVIKGAVATGLYTTSYKILEVTAFIGSYFSSALKPAISRNIRDNNQVAVGSIINKGAAAMFFAALLIVVICLSFSKEIIVFLSNKSFLPAANVLIILSFTLPLIYLNYLLSEVFIANDSRKLLIYIAVFILSFNFVLNLFLIPLFSYFGAATSTLISEIILLFVNIHYTKKIINYKFNLQLMLNIFLVFLISLCLGLLLQLSPINFLISIILLASFYGALSFWFGIINRNSLRELIR